MRRVMTVVLPVPAPATMRRGPASWVTASRCAALRPSRMRSLAMPPRLYYEGFARRRGSAPDVRPSAHHILDIATIDQRDVAPGRTLQRGDGGTHVHRVLNGSAVERDGQKAADEGVASTDRIDDLN